MAANRYRLLAFIGVFLKIAAVAAGTNAEGLKFLEENKQKPGVVTLPSGLQYKVLTEGSGEFHPAPNSPCSCHYAGTLIDGTTFDSSYDRGEPSTFAPNQVIAGWTEAMQLMVQGDKWELYIPSDLGYGDRGSPPKIPGGSVLVFIMEIISISGDTVPASNCNVMTREKCKDKERTYLDKVATWTDAKITTESDRLLSLTRDNSKMKPALADWIRQRSRLLKKLQAAGKTAPSGGKESEAEVEAEL